MEVIKNDGGRKAAGFQTIGRGDCVARSIAIASGRPYACVYGELAELNAGMRKTKGRNTAGLVTANAGIYTRSKPFRDYMTWLGFTWTPTMSIGSGCRVHLREDELPPGRLVVAVSRHYTAVINGMLHDIGDPCRGGTRCVYGIWEYKP